MLAPWKCKRRHVPVTAAYDGWTTEVAWRVGQWSAAAVNWALVFVSTLPAFPLLLVEWTLRGLWREREEEQ